MVNTIVCFICKGVIENLRILPCEHYFCYDCINDRFVIEVENPEMSRMCPECLLPIAIDETFEYKEADLFIKRAFSTIRVSCDFDDCTAVLPFYQLGDHQNSCKYKIIKCERCDANIMRSDLEAHQKSSINWKGLNIQKNHNTKLRNLFISHLSLSKYVTKLEESVNMSKSNVFPNGLSLKLPENKLSDFIASAFFHQKKHFVIFQMQIPSVHFHVSRSSG